MATRREFLAVGVGSAVAAVSCGGGKSTGAGGGTAGARAVGTGPIALTVKFTGLCGLIRTGTPFGLDVLMIDGDATLQQEHHPRLVVDPKYVDAGSTTAPAQTLTDGDGNTFKYWDLKGYQVTQASASAGTGQVDETRGLRRPGSKLPSTSEEPDVTWMPELKLLTPTGKARLNPECLFPDPRSAKVASRIRFNSGTLASRFDMGHIDYKATTFNFLPAPSTPVEQALGEGKLTDQIASDRVTFVLQPFTGGGGSKLIVLKASNSSAGPVEVILRNSYDHQCRDDSEVRKLAHFSAYYDLLIPEDQPAMAQRPIPNASGSNLPNCPHEDEYIRCPGSGYDPHP